MNNNAIHSPFTRFISWVTGDVTSGALMIGAAVIGLLWANTPWRDTYASISAIEAIQGGGGSHAQGRLGSSA